MKTNDNNDNDELLADGLMKISEAAEYLSLGRTKVTQMIEDGTLPYVRFGVKSRRIPRRAVTDLMKANLVKAN